MKFVVDWTWVQWQQQQQQQQQQLTRGGLDVGPVPQEIGGGGHLKCE